MGTFVHTLLRSELKLGDKTLKYILRLNDFASTFCHAISSLFITVHANLLHMKFANNFHYFFGVIDIDETTEK